MYRILYNDSIIFDPYGNDNEVVSDASMSVKINAAAYMDFTMPRLHPLYNTIAERDGVVTLYWDKDILFQGTIESIDMDINGNKAVSCVSALDYLNDTVVRPYSTIAGEQELTAPSSVDGYFQWLIDQHNKHVKDSNKLFYIGVNQGANLQRNNFIYRSSTNNPTTASEISNQIIDSLGGYLLMRYEDGRHILDLYSDVHTMNAQIIDFGVNLKDFSKKIDTNDQYTALIAKGGSPQFMNGGFESGDFSYWESHPDTAIVTDKAQEGSYSSYVIEGVAKYVPASFFYAKKNGRYKSTVYVKNERPSNIVIHAGYQTNVLDSWSNDSKTVPFTIPNDDQWHECSYEFSTGVENNTKIRPYWYSDNMSNSGNRRVYFDGFGFSRLIGNNTVSEDPIDLTLIPNGGTRYDSDIIKSEDVIYNPNRVLRYGYREKVFTDSTITNVEDLMQAAIKELNKLAEPTIGLDVKAIDLALYMDGYTHLNVGDAVRVRSSIHNTDEYLMVSSINLNLQDPANSEYVIGQAYDSLTGQQSGYLRSLSSGINSSLDAVASLDQTTKDQAIKIGSVTEATKKAQDTADSASSKADNAQQSADNAQQTANANKEQISAVKDKQSKQDALIEQAKKDIAASESEISGINDRMTQMDSDIDKVQSDIDSTRQEAQKNFDTANAAANAAQSKADSVGSDLESFRTETNKTVQNVRDSVSKTQSDVDAVTKKTSDLSDDLDATKATVSQTVTEFGEVKTTATNAASKADQSLQVSTQASQTATAASQKATSAYNDAQTAISQSSEAVQTANSVSLSLKTNYQTKADADAKYATQSSLTATSDQIKTEVSKTYATKATVDALENIANNAVQTWTGKGAPTLTNKPASEWSTAALKTQHSGDIYYDTDTGYSYRFGSSDGSTYSWALIKDTDISKAISDAAKAQKTADSATSGVSELKSSIPVTYATKTELTQKADSITSRVEEVAQAGNTTSSKVTQLEQKTDEIKSTVSDQGSKLNNAVTTISQVSQKADSISTSLSQTNKNLDALSSNMIKNPGFETGDFTNWSYTDSSKVNQLYVNSGSQLAGTYKAVIWFPSTAEFSLSANSITAVANHTYEISCWIWNDKNVTIRLGFLSDRWDATNTLFPSGTTGWQRIVTTWKFKSSLSVRPTIIFNGPISDSFPVRLDNFEVRDITEGVEASGTANSALSKASTLEQNLDGFKTTVSQTYETKDDSLQKKTALEQSINGFKTEVSNTYETKNDSQKKQTALEQSINGFKTEVSNTYETKTDALNKQSSLTQTIDGFKTDVSHTYETKTDALAKQSSLNQTIDGFKTTVSQTYATKSSLSTLSNQSDVTYPMVVLSNSNNYWIRLGTATISEQGRITQLTLNVSKGNNGQPDQNAKAIIQIHRGWTGGDSAHQFGVSVDNSNWKDIRVKAISDTTNKVTVWIYNSVSGYLKGNYTVSGWRNSWEDKGLAQTAAPTGTEQQVAMNVSLEDVNDTATAALNKSSTLEQTLDGFKTTVSQTYETKTDSQKKQTALEQSINGFKTEVSNTYETKDEAKQSNLVLNPRFASDTKDWVVEDGSPQRKTDPVYGTYGEMKIGDNGARFYYNKVNGWKNGQTYAYSFLAKASASGSTITPNRGNDLSTAGQTHTITTEWQRFSGTITSNMDIGTFSFNPSNKSLTYYITDVSLVPADSSTIYSTKSYVDQTSRTVSLGVVEEYKKGQHGSALATASDITAAKDSITSTVSKDYLSKKDATNTYLNQGTAASTYLNKDTAASTYATKTEVKQTSDSLTVSIKQSLGIANAAANSVLVKNGDFESNSTEGWSFTGFSSPYVNSNAPYTGTYKLVAPISGSGSHAMVNDAIIPVYQGQKFRFRCALYPDNTINNDLTIGFIGDNNALITSVVGSVTGGRWNTYSAVITVPSGVRSMRARIATNDNSFVNLRVDSITVTDVTDGANAQSTANTASSNAANAQNRVGNLETCIKMTTDGVRVGKISNGNFSGYSALVNSAGSFDVLNGSSKTIAKFSQYGLDVSAGDSKAMFIGMIPGEKTSEYETSPYGYIGSTPSFGNHSGMDLHSGMMMAFSTGEHTNLVNDFGSIDITANAYINLLAEKGHVTINGVDVRGAGVVLFDKDDGKNYASVDIPSQYDFSYFNYIMCFFKTNDGQYFGGTAYHPNGKTYNFTTMGGASTDMSYIKGTQWAFNGTKATRKTSFQIGPGYSTSVNNNTVHIVAILGFDFYHETID